MFRKGLKITAKIILLAFIWTTCLPHMAWAAPSGDISLSRKIQIAVKVTNSGRQTATGVKVQLPLISADSQYQQTIEETFNQKVEKIVEGEAGSRIAHIIIDSIAPGQSETITVNYALQIKPDGGLKASSSSGLQQYLKPSNKIESNHSAIVAKAKELTASSESELDKVNKIGSFISSHMTYKLNSPHKNKGAISALQNGEGVCEDYAALFIALARASGLPARQVNGFADPKLTGASWKSRSQEVSLQGFRHSWAEVYLQGYGWVAVDPTFGIYPQKGKDNLVELSPSHIAQNYMDQPVKVSYSGKNLAVGWGNLLINN
ncbi:MAG TPA: transglutaminase-like domain-containing protein [Syntrophomonadaceae bacterium]|nr:transglutaminase-like domain-containing protein [Syntrophomonadaceae bacterium]